MKTCLITGASGFIGRHLARTLARSDAPTGWQLRLVGRHPERFMQGAGITQHAIGTLDASTDWSQSGVLQGVDVVVHTAARVHLLHDKDTATDALVQYRRTNTEGTLQLARQAALAGVRRFVFLSTIGVHGNGQNQAYQETDAPAPHSPYAQSKFEAEQGLLALSAHTGMEVVVIRPPLVYGPNAPGNFARLAAVVRRGLPLPLGSVQNLRSWVSVDNLVDFIQCCLVHLAAVNQIFLVSDGEDLSTPALIRRMGLAMHHPARLLPVPVPLLRWGAACVGKQAMLHQLTSTLQVDIRKARTVLAWAPPWTLDAGLAKTFSHTIPTP